jgi:cytochrome P450
VSGVAAGVRPEQTQAANGINLLRPDVLLNPYPHYAAMRRAGSVHFLTEHGFWLVLGYDDVVHALKHPELFSSARPTVRFDPVLNEADPPAHTRVRRILSPHFSSRSAQSLGEYAADCAVELLGKGDRAGLDLVDGFAVPLTEMSMGRLLGLSVDETEDLRRRLAPHARRLDGELYRLLEEWLRAYLERQRERPGDSLGGRLIRGEGEAALAHEEIVGVLKLLWVAGTTTTSRLISAAALLLLRHPLVRAELRGDPSLLPAFVEEAMRMEASEQMVWRVARESVELSGARIPAGAEVRLCIAAANRDPQHFSEPDEPSLRRNPNHHLSFAAGPHFCLGAAAGRAMARAALETLLTRWPDFAAARSLSEVSYEESFSSRALEHLYVRAA